MSALDFFNFNKRMIEASSRFSARIKHAFNISDELGNNTLTLLSNSKSLLSTFGKISIRDIFKKYWTFYEDFASRHNIFIRTSIIDNVYAMMKCGSFDEDNGYLYFECPNDDCNNLHIQPFTCKSETDIDLEILDEFGFDDDVMPEFHCNYCPKGIMKPKYILKK